MTGIEYGNDKQQFFDPITAMSRMVLLQFSDHNTKIRIENHTVQLDDDSVTKKIMRSWYGDSRNDICKLYPVFVRFIELYLLEKYKLAMDTNDKMTLKCYECLRKIGEYAILGISELQRTYGYDNAALALQFYIRLIRDGLDGTYTSGSLPTHLNKMTKDNLLDDTKVQKIWEDSHIIELGDTFESMVAAKEKSDNLMLGSNKKKIIDILDAHDVVFRRMLAVDKPILH